MAMQKLAELGFKLELLVLLLGVVAITSDETSATTIKVGVFDDPDIAQFLSKLDSSQMQKLFSASSIVLAVKNFSLGPDPETASQMQAYIEYVRAERLNMIIGNYNSTAAGVADVLGIPYYCFSAAHESPDLRDTAYLKSSTLFLMNNYAESIVQASQKLVSAVIKRQTLIVVADVVGNTANTVLNSVTNQSLFMVQFGNTTDRRLVSDALFNLNLRAEIDLAVFQTLFDVNTTLELTLAEAASLSLMTNKTYWIISDVFPDTSLLLAYRRTGAAIFSFALTAENVTDVKGLRLAMAEDAVGHYLKSLGDPPRAYDINEAFRVNYRGVFGQLEFDSVNRRNKESQLKIRLISYRADNITEFGSWSNPIGVHSTRDEIFDRKPHLKALAFMRDPFIMQTVSEYFGFCINVMSDLSDGLFTYEVVEVPDESLLLTMLRNGSGDLILNPIRAPSGSHRFPDVSYSPWPIMFTAVSAMGSAEVSETDFLGPLYPFSWNVWLAVILAFVLLALTLYAIDKISPNDYKRSKFSVSESAFFVFSSFMMSKLKSNAVKPSSRIFILILWFASLMYCTTYGTNYFFMLIRSNQGLPFSSLYGLNNMSSRYYRILVSNGSAWQSLTAQPPNSYYHKLAQADVWVPSENDALALVSNGTLLGKRRPIFVGDQNYIKYFVAKSCDLKSAGQDELHLPMYQVLSSRLELSLIQAINLRIQEMSDRGQLDQYQDTYWSAVKCSSNEKLINLNDLRSLKIDQLAGIFIVLACALAFSFFVLLLEHAYHLVELCIQRKQVDPELPFMVPFRAQVTSVSPQGITVRVDGEKIFLPNQMLSPDPNQKMTAVDLQIRNYDYVELIYTGNDPKTGDRLFKRTG